ncbi:MAG: hypothetical protein K9L86_05590 [Candidatus Omnitrophica bacterium]|nr:hypothetical protein [Candidatus Omnitrophota bacterium]
MKKPLNCKIFAYGSSPFLSQLYTGFSILAKNREINLVQKLNNYRYQNKKPISIVKPNKFKGLFVMINEEKLIFYDTKDDPRLDSQALNIVDAYFKRSYLASAIPENYKSKVFPLGLHYKLYTGKPDRYDLIRLLKQFKSVGYVARHFGRHCGLSYKPTPSKMSSAPNKNQEPRVIFSTHAWNPDKNPPGLSAKSKEERIQINETRAQVIRLLRKNLGKRFYGGFRPDRYAVSNFKDILLKNDHSWLQKNYIPLLRQYPICIATTGLSGSIGWKLGEYVALSKAIVSEKLNYLVPGGFSKNINYLEFDKPESCLQETIKLIENRDLRLKIMNNNWKYYKKYLAPDVLIMRTLRIAMEI